MKATTLIPSKDGTHQKEVENYVVMAVRSNLRNPYMGGGNGVEVGAPIEGRGHKGGDGGSGEGGAKWDF